MDSPRMFKPKPPAIMQFLNDLENDYKTITDHIRISTINPKINPLMDDEHILRNIITIIRSSENDTEAFLKLMEYFQSIPVQAKDKEIQSFGEYMNLNKPVQMTTLPTRHALPDENLKELQEFYERFLTAYKSVYQWEYSYPLNENGEIMTPGFAEWQEYMTKAKFTNDLNESIWDFNRGTTIRNGKYKESANSSDKIDFLCEELKNTKEDDIKLYAAWLKKCGGQKTHGYLNIPFKDNYFGNDLEPAITETKIMDWTIINNQLVSTYSTEITIISSMDGKIYYKERGQPFINVATNENMEFIFTNPDKLDPILKIDGKVALTIAKNENQESVVVPKLVELKITCTANRTRSDIILHDPKENIISNELKQEKNNHLIPGRTP